MIFFETDELKELDLLLQDLANDKICEYIVRKGLGFAESRALFSAMEKVEREHEKEEDLAERRVGNDI